jgi:hypothetical protein
LVAVCFSFASIFLTCNSFIHILRYSFIPKHSLRPIFLLHSRRLSGRHNIIVVDQEKVPKTRTIT